MNLSPNLLRSIRSYLESGAPAVLGLWRQDAGANMREANGPKGEPQMRRVILMYSTVHSGSCAPASRPTLDGIGSSRATILR